MAKYQHQNHERILRDTHNKETCQWATTGDKEVTIFYGYVRKDGGDFISWGYDSPVGTSIVIDATASGLNGADSVPLSADTDYFIFILDDGANAYGWVSKEFYPPALPGGMVNCTNVGWVKTDSSGNFLEAGNIAARVEVDSSPFSGILAGLTSTAQGALERIDEMALDKTGDSMSGDFDMDSHSILNAVLDGGGA